VLNFIYYPVSAILWFWHEVFGVVLGPDNGFAWMLSVIFLVATLRALLIKPFISQMRSMRKMQEFQPQIKKLQEKYKGDRTKLAEEMQKLQKEHGVNPLGGCLPLFVQLPVFIGLFHVLRGFQPNYPYNYVFDRSGIVSFNNADLFGVRLSDAISGTAQALGHFSLNFGDFRPEVLPVALPLMIAAAIATHFTARISQAHQSAASAANPQAAILGKLTMWLFPIGLLVFGAFFPVAILIYFLSNNTWTLTQQFLVYRKIDREEQGIRDQAREQRDMLAPKPGQKPTRPGRGAPAEDRVDAASSTDPSGASTEPQDAPRPASDDDVERRHPGKIKGEAGNSRGSGRPAPGKTGAVAANGATKNGKNGTSKNGTSKNGTSKNGSGKNGTAGASGNGTNGSARTPGKVGGAKSSEGKASNQLASSGRPGKRSKKRR